MKKKLIIKESELENFVKNFLNEDQMEIDFPVEKDSLTEMLEMKYQEITEEISQSLNDIEVLENIYDDKIFHLTKSLHKLPEGTDIADKFSELEDVLVNYLELKKEHLKLTEELDNSLGELESLL